MLTVIDVVTTPVLHKYVPPPLAVSVELRTIQVRVEVAGVIPAYIIIQCPLLHNVHCNTCTL